MENEHKTGQARHFRSIVVFLSIILTIIAAPGLYSESRAQFDSHFDELIHQKMEQHGIPGTVIVIVKDGEIFFSQGYGYANRDEKIPVDPVKSLFRVGSISKVLTGTAVMHMIEQGKIDMYADVNKYLQSFQIPATFDTPITMKHLLTHTAGFDDRYIGKSARNLEDRISLAEYSEKHLPQRIMPPGEIYTYSNYGNALAGFLVETVTGMPFAEYVDSAILKPLGMKHSGFELSPDIEPYLVRGYSDLRGDYRAIPFDYLLDAPAGQFVASGEDMARFMITHLQKGELYGKRIVSENAIREMHSVQFKNHPALYDGVGYTFSVGTMKGERSISHGGAYAGFYALMTLFPEHNSGVFIAHNILKTDFVSDVMEVLLDGLFNDTRHLAAGESFIAPGVYDTNVAKFTGTYRHTRYPRTTYDKIGILVGAMGGEMKITKTEEGLIVMPDIYGNQRRLVKVEPLLFQSIDDNYNLAFREDGNGRITHVFTSGVNAMERIPWYSSIGFHRLLFIFFPLFFLMVVLISVFSSTIRKVRSGIAAEITYPEKSFKRFHLWVAMTFLFHIAATLIVIGALVSIDEMVSGFPYGLPDAMYVVQIIPFAMILFAVVLLVYVIRDWYEKKLKLTHRIYYSGYVLVSTTAIVFLNYWNLIGFTF